MSARWLAQAEARRKQGQALAQMKEQDLVMRQQRRMEAEGGRAEMLSQAKAVRVEREKANPRSTAMIGGAGGHEGGAPSPVVRRADTREVPAGHGVPARHFLDEGRFVADGGHGSPVRMRPRDHEAIGIYGEVVRTTGMDRSITDKPTPKAKPNTKAHQPNPMNAHGGRYVPEGTMVDNTRSTPSSARAPHKYSGKHDTARPTGKSTFKEGGIVKAKRVGKPSAWISHVKAYQNQNGCSYKEAMVKAKATYQK